MEDIKITLGDLMYNLIKIKNYYESESKKENNKLNNYIKAIEKKKTKKLKIDINQVTIDTKNFWKELILDAVSILLDKINKRKTKGSEFSKIKKDLQKTKDDLPYDDLDIETLRSYYEEDLKSYRDQIREKIEIERHQRKQFWLGIIIGFILGIFTSAIFWLISIL